MRKILFSALTLGFVALSPAARADLVYHCTDTNNTLSFNLLINADESSGVGRMYLNNIQIANLDLFRVNQDSVRGTVNGNAASSELVFNAARQQVFIEINSSSETVCNASITR